MRICPLYTLPPLLITAMLAGCGSDTPEDGDTASSAKSSLSSSSDAAASSVGAYPLAGTAQVTCYDSFEGAEITCTGSGYDADYPHDLPSYHVDDSVITDNVTGLMWTQSSDLDGDGASSDVDDKRSDVEAVAYCEDLTLQGYDDWRLPDIKTLYSLILFTGEDPSGYSGDTTSLTTFLSSDFSRAFGDEANGERIIDGQYASTTRYGSTTLNGSETLFGVNFIDGRIKGYPVDKTFYVLCVRGDTSYGQNAFIDNGDATISDRATGLMWEQNDRQSTDFEDAVTSCETATTGGYSDWRLPDVKALQSIVDYDRAPDTTQSAAIDPVFNATPITNEAGETDWGFYWSSTTHASALGGQAAAYVAFGRALGYMNGEMIDVHGAGAQRSNAKITFDNDPDIESGVDAQGETFYYKGPQGDISRIANMVRCVRDEE